MAHILKARRIFNGQRMLHNQAVVIEGRFITAILKPQKIPDDAVDLGDSLLVPGFIDVQVNGGGGINLNDTPTVAGVEVIARSHRRFGTTGLLPTVITDTAAVQQNAVDAVTAAQRHTPSVLGIHIEGPFLDTARRGAHDPALIRAMTEADVAWLCSLSCGKVLVTVAPNKVAPSQIARLTAAGIHVCLGHAEASAIDVEAALAAGATGFTHLFNAMSQLGPREAGMVGTALANVEAYAGIIPDGFHVAEEVLKLAFAARPNDRMMLVTDAMAPAAGGPDQFKLQGRLVTRTANRLTLEDGTLAGSNLTMDEALRFCVVRLGMALEVVLPMTSTNAAAYLGLNGRLGQIEPGHLASIVQLDAELHVVNSWVEGQALHAV